MSGGLAKQLADQYPNLEKDYSEYCKRHNNRYIDLSGDVLLYKKGNKFIANIFSQRENFDTDYLNMEIALKQIIEFAKINNLSVSMPYGIGCGIANGEWNKVYKIIKEVFENSNIQCTLYKL